MAQTFAFLLTVNVLLKTIKLYTALGDCIFSLISDPEVFAGVGPTSWCRSTDPLGVGIGWVPCLWSLLCNCEVRTSHNQDVNPRVIYQQTFICLVQLLF